MPKPGMPALRIRRHKEDAYTKGVEIAQNQLILYRDAEEFRVMNPNCCNFGREGQYSDIDTTELWMKITGDSAGFFNAK